MPQSEPQWFYLDASNQTVGPVSLSEICALPASYDFYVWTEGMANWTLASDCFAPDAGSTPTLRPDASSVPAGTSGKLSKGEKRRKLGRTAKELIAICHGVIADGHVTPAEVQLLHSWIKEHPEVWQDWPVNVLGERIEQALADGQVDKREQAELREIMEQITADPCTSVMKTPSANAITFDNPLPHVEFEERSFAFIGKFVHGTLMRCKHAVKIRGGIAAAGIYDDANYVVVGALGATSEKCAELRDVRKGRKHLTVIPESHWHAALESYSEGLLVIYGEEDSSESGVKPFSSADFALPQASGWFSTTLTISSFSGSGSYSVDLKGQTCTCPDFLETRSHFRIGDVRRACKHLCHAIIAKRLEMPIFLEDTVRNRVELERGFPSGDWFEWCEVDGYKIFAGAHHSGWVNLFAPSLLRGGAGPYDEFGYSLWEERWAYGERPFRSRRLERFMHERSGSEAR